MKDMKQYSQWIDPQFDTIPDTLEQKKPIVYWCLREHRLHDNRSLALAQTLAKQAESEVLIVSAFRKDFSHSLLTERTFSYIVDGLQELEEAAHKHNLSYTYLQGDPTKTIPEFLTEHQAQVLITDLFPLPIYRTWYHTLQQKIDCPLLVVDARNAVPIWKASQKQEYAARTFRPKFWKTFSTTSAIPLKILAGNATKYEPTNWEKIKKSTKTTPLPLKKAVSDFPKGGTLKAEKTLDNFCKKILTRYKDDRNDPTKNATSQLSAAIHFGHLSVTQIINAVEKSAAKQAHKDAFLEEFLVRRELAENFAYYTNDPTSLESAPTWAQETLQNHQQDTREYLYTYQEFLHAQTHDPAWNAAQTQLLQTGYMHGYMRMYWAKKILEWSKSPQEAISIACTLNDLLQLDGRSPNGSVGVLWAIAGLHDRPWFERPIYGKIRYMNFNGLKRKFSIDDYITTWSTK